MGEKTMQRSPVLTRLGDLIYIRIISHRGEKVFQIEEKLISNFRTDCEEVREELETQNHWYPCDFEDEYTDRAFYHTGAGKWNKEEQKKLMWEINDYVQSLRKCVRVKQLTNM